MAYLALLWKARTIEKYRLKYEKEKINSINSKTEVRSTLYQKRTVYRNDSQKKLDQIYRNWCPEGSKLAKSCTFVKENSSFLLRIVIGIVGGILTYFLYTVFVFHLTFWTVLSLVIGVAITMGVAFSNTVRCLVLLLIPGLFSRVGRYTLACYALVLILTGPAANTLKNLDTLSASLACGQEQIKSSVKEIKESKESPLNLVKETMDGTIEKIEYLTKSMKKLLVGIHRLTMSIAHVLQSSLSWLNSVEITCNEKLGSPYVHCTKVLSKGTEDCLKEFPEFTSKWKWSLFVQAVCFNLKPEDSLCLVGDFAKGSIVATVKKKLNTYSNRISSLLSVGVHIRRSHSCCSNGSMPVSQSAAGVITELRNRADTLLAWLSWTCALTGLFLMLIIFRAKYYLHMFRTRSRFDNRYVTVELRELDLKRQRQGRETVLPLNTRERAKYVSTSSIRLLPSEKIYLTRSIVFMVITTLKLMIHMVADYSLYWVLMNVRFHGSEQTSFQPTNRTSRIHVSGSGPLAATVRTLLDALSMPLILPASSTTSCLPDPNPPDLQRYAQIGTLILLLWLLALFEPYGLRLRHVISGHYQPERAKARAVWLYYHIIRTRSCFLKYARRKLHKQFKYTSEEKFTFKNWLNNCIPCQWLRTLLGVGPAEPHCLLCYTKHRQEDLDRHLKRCETPSCPGIYCARCFMDIGQLCTICYSPEDYGDLSDVSLEKFTTDESESDDSDDDDGDTMPLVRKKRDCEIKDFENGVQSKRNKKQTSTTLLKSRCENRNEESTPLLECGYYKNYTQQDASNTKQDNDIVNENYSVRKKAREIISQLDVTEDNTSHKLPQNGEDKKFQLSTSEESRRSSMVFKNKEITVNGVTFPKGKLGAIIKVMMLLTTKDETNDKHKSNIITKHKPVEYQVMEMFQFLDIFQKMILARHDKFTSCNEDHVKKKSDKEVQFLYDNAVFDEKYKSTEALDNIDLRTDFNFKNSEPILKHVEDVQSKNKRSLIKMSKKLWATRRNVKRFLDIKRSITNNVKERSENFRINCSKHKLTCTKRRRRNKTSIGFGLISLVSKVFSNKSIDREISDPLHEGHDEYAEGDNVREINKMYHKKGKQEELNQKEFENHQKTSKQENECSLQSKAHSLSNTTKGETLYIQSNEDSNDECPSKESNEVNGAEAQNSADHKARTMQTKHATNQKLGFWGSLRLRRRRTRSPLFSISLKKEPSFYNFFANYKRRKKTQKAPHVTPGNANDASRNIRLSRSLKNDESNRRMAKYNGIMDMENNEFLGLDPAMTESLKKEENKSQKREVKFIDKFKEANTKKTEIKAKLAEGMHQDDDKNKEAPGRKSNLGKRLRSLSQMACNFSKKKKGPRSVVFSDGLVEQFNDSETESDDEVPFIQVESNDALAKEPPCRHPKVVHYESSDDDTDFEEDVKLQIKQDNICQVEPVAHEEQESEESVEITPIYHIDRHIEYVEPCIHEWRVEPKKQGICQTNVSDDEEDHLHVQSVNMVHRCFQVTMNETKMNNTEIIKSSAESLKNSKRTQIKSTCHCNDRLKMDIETEAVSKLQERWCHCEDACSPSQETKVNCSVQKHIETQCLPTYHAAVQSSNISNIAKKYHTPMKPYKGKIIKEVTERLIWPSDSDEIRLEYADEKTPKLKRNKMNETGTSNRSTTTITKAVADVSTITSDWWSPMFERKPIRRKTEIIVENNSHPNKHKVSVHKWGSSLLLHESGGVLSASNYLLQSENMYNQVYSLELSSSRGSQPRVKKHYENEGPTLKVYRQLRRGSRTKRLMECYSASQKRFKSSVFSSEIWVSNVCGLSERYRQRKQACILAPAPSRVGLAGVMPNKLPKEDNKLLFDQVQNQSSSVNIPTPPAKWRPVVTEEQAHALKYYKRRISKHKKANRKSKKMKHEKDSEQYSQTNSNMWTASVFSSSY